MSFRYTLTAGKKIFIEAEKQSSFLGQSYKGAMEWLGHARISYTHAVASLSLKCKDGTSTNLLQVCQESTPPCRLNPLLFNGHLQTMWTAVKDDGPPVFYKRKIFEADDAAYEGTFAVDFAVEPKSETDDSLPPRTTYYSDDEFNCIESSDDRPMLVTLHGLSGGSYEVYLRHVLAPLIGKHGGWEACVVNARGCAQHKITSSVLFNARATWDMRQTVKVKVYLWFCNLLSRPDVDMRTVAKGEVPEPASFWNRLLSWSKHSNKCEFEVSSIGALVKSINCGPCYYHQHISNRLGAIDFHTLASL
jgi:hypothetical protein